MIDEFIGDFQLYSSSNQMHPSIPGIEEKLSNSASNAICSTAFPKQESVVTQQVEKSVRTNANNRARKSKKVINN